MAGKIYTSGDHDVDTKLSVKDLGAAVKKAEEVLKAAKLKESEAKEKATKEKAKAEAKVKETAKPAK